MSGIVTAINAANALTSLGINLLLAGQKYNDLAGNAATEGRDVSKEELDALQAESHAKTQRALEALRGTED